ncbi:hypothetical protein [Streptomyces sp. NPDC048636]|uniref:hypothetical protein n=1 Tax=Streptomyces sp. NPDC048636 TaxID=3155762 RepID=UPI00343DA01A
MTSLGTPGIERAAAEAALSVPGVAGLQPSLRHTLAVAGARVRRAVGSTTPSPEAGVRAERRPRTGAWTVEVRCVVTGDRRALDTARAVQERVGSRVGSLVPRSGTPEPVTVVVIVTRVE